MEKRIIAIFANSIHKAHDKAVRILGNREVIKKTRYLIETEDIRIELYEVGTNYQMYRGLRCNALFIHDSLTIKSYQILKDCVRIIGDDDNIYTFD